MKILIVMGGFFPGKKYGGPPVSVDNFCSLMKDFSECYIYTRNHDLGENKQYPHVKCNQWIERSNCKVFYVSDGQFNKAGFEDVINEISPDIIYLQGLFQSCILPCLIIAKRKNIRVVLAPRGELCAGALAIKKYKKLPYIYFLKSARLVRKVIFQSTSDEESEAIHSLLGIPYDRIHLLTNIPSIPEKKYVRFEKVRGEGKFIFLARIHPKKNLLSAIRYFKSIEGTVKFDIYGPIEDEDYWKECQDEIAKLPNNVTVEYCGLVPHDKVHETFSRYDAFIFPTLSENYGHVIAESLFAGTPVIISDQTPWTDVNGTGAGWAASLNNPSCFIEGIQNVIDDCENREKSIEEYLNVKLNMEHIKSEYEKVFEEI